MKRIIVSGGTGYVGSRLVERLVARGDEVTVLTRGAARPGNPRRAQWNPYEMGDWSRELEGADAVVHLSGERAVGVRYTEANKRRIYTVIDANGPMDEIHKTVGEVVTEFLGS